MTFFIRIPAKAALIVVFLLLTPAWAGVDLTELNTRIMRLPEQTSAEQLKKATLLWALEDAQAAREQGFPERAEITLHDVETLLPKPIGVARPAPENLFPRRPTYQITTYPAAGTLERSGPKRDRTALAYLLEGRYLKGPPGDIVSSPTNGWVAIKTAYQAETLAMALCHPESPYAGDPRLIAPLFRRFENAYEFMVPGNRARLADFGPTPPLSQMYLLLKTVYPDLILPSRQAAWEAAIRLNCDTILESRETLFAEAKPGTAYVNADVKYLSGLVYAGVLFNNPRYIKAGENGVRLIGTSIYPDGGSAYIGWQNEVFTYHGIFVSELARVAQVTGNELALALVKRTSNYYPLSYIVNRDNAGVAEFATASSWKQNWNGASPGGAAVLVEHYTGRRQVVPPDESYFVYDRNIEGPRGRFSNFAFFGTARDLHDDPRGKNTYVGCMALLPEGKQAFSSGLAVAGIEIASKPGATGRALFSLTRSEHNATTVTKDFATLTTAHRLGNYGASRPSDWAGAQAWLFTQDRLVGLVCVETLSDQQNGGLTGVLQFINPQKGGQPLETVIAGSRYKTGKLNIKLQAHDYGAVQADSAAAKFTRINLVDTASSYSKGSSHFYLVELYPDVSTPAKSVTRTKFNNGLIGFEVKAAGKTHRVVFNATGEPQVYRLSPTDADADIHREGGRYRPAWISPEGREEHAPVPTRATRKELTHGITVPPYSHVTLVSQPRE